MRRWIREHRGLVAVAITLGVAGAALALIWFQPQKLFIDARVDETLPGFDAAAATTTTTTPPTTTTQPGSTSSTATTSSTTTSTTTTTAPPGPVTLHQSMFIEVGHAGTGDVLVVELPDGSRLIRFENLDVSNGPDLRVILSPSPLVDDRNAYDDGDFLDLGPLKGNQGNQNYEIPADASLEDYATVAIWCRRFNYTFNAATIRA